MVIVFKQCFKINTFMGKNQYIKHSIKHCIKHYIKKYIQQHSIKHCIKHYIKKYIQQQLIDALILSIAQIVCQTLHQTLH